ncbi:MAG: hypothetical protein LBB83_05040 [Treponema sp.]|jgi:hypothetical protein|nr:hypothetical protein [Treponema sp.]
MAFGRNDTKTIAMSILDYSLENEDAASLSPEWEADDRGVRFCITKNWSSSTVIALR